MAEREAAASGQPGSVGQATLVPSSLPVPNLVRCFLAALQLLPVLVGSYNGAGTGESRGERSLTIDRLVSAHSSKMISTA